MPKPVRFTTRARASLAIARFGIPKKTNRSLIQSMLDYIIYTSICTGTQRACVIGVIAGLVIVSEST